ncbi:hypothetical protein UA08_06149 [Talaromyces atroroseus]|uniref:ubiquitinyl hydrolase 1 n=1 Tax=Talaromyces atroroseus TaxID=1441469 RepID=A0A225AS75_TALAT|nr:hypothetical protein UA08_06149 [Talaromyces atroroseus]OKL58449.1 hypothetical protein UA08_06149 [Talaromyces atroroseus]
MPTSFTPSIMSLGAMKYMFHHVFLPPKLPQEDDYNPEYELALLDSVIQALKMFKTYASEQQDGILASVIEMVARLKRQAGFHGDVNESKLLQNLQNLNHHDLPSDILIDSKEGFLPIYVHSQNAAVLLTAGKSEIQMEAFELSPSNKSVYSTVGRLQRQFPGPAFAMDRNTFEESTLQHTIAQTLSRMSCQSVAGTTPKVRKAGQLHEETRDTTKPSMVTELFVTFLRPQCHVLENIQIQKNTREEVLWSKTRMPWRRSSFWLLIRVLLQLILQRLCVDEGLTTELYKHFMVFYMSMILQSSSEKIETEEKYIMTAKITRRLRKLDLAIAPAWFCIVEDALGQANSSIQQAWDVVVSQTRLKVGSYRLENLKSKEDIYCSLPGLDEWLESIHRRQSISASTDFQPQPKLRQYQPTELPSCLDFDDPEYGLFNLAAVESWVESHLESWLGIHLAHGRTCQQLRNLIDHYHNVALPVYSTNPEAISTMLLTILELWIACDKSAIHLHPMLREYDCSIPMTIYSSLVLPYRSQMIRLEHAEEYMEQRRSRVLYRGPGIFKDFGTSTCFPVRYFDKSADHQSLLVEIEEQAVRAREAKRTELELKQENYRNLYALVNEMECTYIDTIVDFRFDIHESRHSPSCRRCLYEEQAQSISIEVHEWPLSDNHLQAKSTVFELMRPQPFAWWREATLCFLSILHVEYSVYDRPRADYRPQSYRGLSYFYTHIEDAERIHLLSQVKPNLGTHRKDKQIIHVTNEDVCVKNGMYFKYHDDSAHCFVADLDIGNETTATLCTYQLPEGSSSLQKFLSRPAASSDGPPPNTVIASLDACPEAMTLAEYRALCAMPLGIHIQWQNILRQLAMPSVVWKKTETCVFLLQVINQAGPTGDSFLRTGHVILKDDRFAVALLTEIRKSAERIQENWESAQELWALILITQRVLSLADSAEIHNLCFDHLSYLRDVAFGWVGIVRDKANSTVEGNHRTYLMAHSAHIALICVSTFDTEGAHLSRALWEPSAVTIFFQCCMMIHDRKGILDMQANTLLPILLFRWKSLSYRYYRVIAKSSIRFHEQSAGLDEAIARTWAAYRKGSPWSVISRENDYWLVTRMARESSQTSGLCVHYNILTGELLIDGRPLASLPSKYERHHTYQTLFGRSLVEVMPSNLPGMQFSGQRRHMGYTIHFRKQAVAGSRVFDLCVRAVNEGETWEFIPSRLFTGWFPDAFVEDYAHWYNVEQGYVEFRPIKQPWLTSDGNWKLQKDDAQRGWCVVKGSNSLVCLQSETAKRISEILSPVENASKLQCILVNCSIVEIEIPRLRTSFTLQVGNSSIRSRQYPGMVIAEDQSLGTLVGLYNRLILKNEITGDRIVLIPEGHVTWKRVADHIAVDIKWQPVSCLHSYSVDSQLGRLVDNGSLQSKLLLCYLHAVTSFCIPDPLTGKTGTEQSLSILRSASLRSFTQLQLDNITILARLAELTPQRQYYPANEKSMQNIEWQKNLSCLSHHEDFRKEVVEIFDQDRRMRLFYPNIRIDLPALPKSDPDLLQRARMRSSTFRVSDFGAEDHTTMYDHFYSGRDRDYQSDKCSRIYTLCESLSQNFGFLGGMGSETVLSHLWNLLAKYDSINGPEVRMDSANIRYDASYILDPIKFIATNWCGIHRLFCADLSRPNKYQVMIWLSTLAFSKKSDMVSLRVLAAMYTIIDMGVLWPPRKPRFQPKRGFELDEQRLRSDINNAIQYTTPESNLSQPRWESYSAFQKRIKKCREENRRQALDGFMRDLRLQWPTASPTVPRAGGNPTFADYFDINKAMHQVNERFSVWFDNRQLRHYLMDIVTTIIVEPVKSRAMPPLSFQPAVNPASSRRRSVSVDDILSDDLGPLPVVELDPPCLDNILRTSSTSDPQVPSLVSILSAFESQPRSKYESQYLERLQASIKSLQRRQKYEIALSTDIDLRGVIQAYEKRCRDHLQGTYKAIHSRLSISFAAANMTNAPTKTSLRVWQTLSKGHTWPRLSPDLLLQQLTRKRWPRIPEKWKRCFLAYGRSITVLQRAKRLLSLVDRPEDLIQELQNQGHSNWDPYDYPESLLLEIENGILIRDVQEEIARKMRTLQPGSNVVMQLNMGEGKSSVIVPIVAAALADGSRLVRVLVAKPQSRQMLHMLVSKLGGLLGRRIYQLPVSRSLQIGVSEADEIERMCRDCMKDGGILLVQPEQVLSFRLMCLESFISGQVEVGKSIFRTLRLFRDSSRDVVDESDENFSVKFELIYTMGAQQPLEFSPERWIVVQQVLDLVRKYALDVKEKFTHSIEVYQHRPGRFPRIRLLRDHASEELLQRVAQHICENGIDSLAISRQTEKSRAAILTYILSPELSAQEIDAVEDEGPSSFWTESTKDALLLLRGLLAGGVLAFCFGQKRWRVNYGPDRKRNPPSRLSVPYRAKDNPTPRSEFSHPEVVIVLTCLNYYYGGLDDDEVLLAFNHLVKSDQGQVEFQTWVNDVPELPQVYRQLGGINLQDRFHCVAHVFPHFKFSKGAIDYFLSHIVFPKEIKEFPSKLSASGWDIGELKPNPTVGFSGTNDSRETLPLSVTQLDLPEQNHTNALVLEYLLRPENSVTFTPTRANMSRSDAQVLLDMVVTLDPPTQVILDVGAQILELTNLEVAQAWLGMTSEDRKMQAVVFVNELDVICVVDRSGVIEPLQISPFAQQLDACYVFLDEAHTRGIDLRLPPTYRAAVTLGAGMTKDKLVQACMRMRKLGKGQSVVFCISEEISTKISALTGTSAGCIGVPDVLRWALTETWVDTYRSIPLWAVQGERFEWQAALWDMYNDQPEIPAKQAKAFLEEESQTLEQRYRPRRSSDFRVGTISSGTGNLQLIRQKCRLFSDLNFNSAELQEEQERELAPEIEREQQVQRPPPAKPKDHQLHEHVLSFVSTGVLAASAAFRPAFEILRNTSAADHLDLSEFPPGLLATRDFAETVLRSKGRSCMDDYQRPVEWLLTSHDPSSSIVKHMLIISPHEANKLLSEVQMSEVVMMHVYAPRQNRNLLSLDELNLYPVSKNVTTFHIPTVLRIQLNLFAGQLYISSYDEYRQMCDFLGVLSTKTPSGYVVAADGFVMAMDKPSTTSFTKSPLKCLRTLISQMRKDGQEIGKTHVGKILDGKLLYPSDFEEGDQTSMTMALRFRPF